MSVHSSPTLHGEISTTLEQMRQVLVQHFRVDDRELSLESSLESLGLDSLAFIEYTFELEKKLHILLPDLPRDLVTVGDLARVVDSEVRRQTRASAA